MTEKNMTPADLAALSAAATPGELDARGWGNGSTQMGMTNLFNDEAEVCVMECIPEQDAKFIAALWNAYRSGDLVLIDREGMREAVDSLSGVKAWLQRWAAHVGNCRGDHTCTCGLKRAKYDLDLADAAIAAILGEKP